MALGRCLDIGDLQNPAQPKLFSDLVMYAKQTYSFNSVFSNFKVFSISYAAWFIDVCKLSLLARCTVAWRKAYRKSKICHAG